MQYDGSYIILLDVLYIYTHELHVYLYSAISSKRNPCIIKIYINMNIYIYIYIHTQVYNINYFINTCCKVADGASKFADFPNRISLLPFLQQKIRLYSFI